MQLQTQPKAQGQQAQGTQPQARGQQAQGTQPKAQGQQAQETLQALKLVTGDQKLFVLCSVGGALAAPQII